MELGQVKARHGVGVSPDGQDGVPGPGVELLPGHLSGRLGSPEVAGGGQRGHSDEGVAAVLGDGVEEGGRLGVQGGRVEVVETVGGSGGGRRHGWHSESAEERPGWVGSGSGPASALLCSHTHSLLSEADHAQKYLNS